MVFIEVLRYDRNWEKKPGFLAHFERFFVYPLIYPMSYAPRFFQMKDLIKTHVCGKFYQYSICGCEVKIFKSFFYYFRIHKRPTSESMKDLPFFFRLVGRGGG